MLHRITTPHRRSRSHGSRALPYPLAALALAALAALSGCGRKEMAEAAPKPPPPPPKVSDLDLKSYHPNEAGAIMILMYHRFEPNVPNNDMNRTPDQFRQDLLALYKRGYRPVNVSELVEDKMDVPAGKTPVVLTFDDSYESQFKTVVGADGQTHIDPNCAVGILETFHKDHADWPMKGMFFILPQQGKSPAPFYQPEAVADKLAYLLKSGYEVGNHTTTHTAMDRLSPEKLQWELATPVRYLKEVAPTVKLKVMALPYGRMPRKAERGLLLKGQSGGQSYANEAVLTAAWRPVLSPVTRPDKRLTSGGSFAIFDPHHLERIKPDPRQAKTPGTFEYWLKYFDEHPAQRYVSDGNPLVVTVPRADKGAVNEKKVVAEGKVFQPYAFGAATGIHGVDLNVE